MKIRIRGTGSYLPEKVLDNAELSTMVDTSDEWIISRTGISERRISVGEATWQMGLKAVQKALENANVKAEEIDLIIGTTSTPDYYFPSMACIIQGEIGATNAFAFDLSAACSGFVFALDTVTSFIKAKRVKKALIVCSETLSKITDYEDRSTCVLFGDGAGAIVIEEYSEDGVLGVYSKSEGEGAKFLVARALRNDTPFSKDETDIAEGLNKHYLHMDGKDVYRFAIRAMPKAIEEVLKVANLSAEDVTYFLPHQANKRIIDSACNKFGYDMDKTVINLDTCGNTSSASIPIMLDEINREGRLKNGDILMFTGFGAGLTYGAAIIKWLI